MRVSACGKMPHKVAYAGSGLLNAKRDRGESSNCFGADHRTFCVFGAIGGVPLLVSLLAALKEPSFWGAVAICVLLLTALFFWIVAFRICITEKAISYRTLFGGTKCLEFSQIKSYKMEKRLYSAFGPAIRLVITSKAAAGVRAIVINVKVFGKKDLKQLFETLESTVS